MYISRRSVASPTSLHDPRRRGAILVWVAIMGLMLIGFVGLAMDAGVVLLAGSQLQVAADAAALAGARWVTEDQALARRSSFNIAYANKAAGWPVKLDLNGGNSPDGDIVLGRYHRSANEACPAPPCFFPEDPSPNAVQVRARRTTESPAGQVPLVFGASPVFNVEGVNVTRSATAMIAKTDSAGLIVLCPDCDCALDMGGTPLLEVRPMPDYDGSTAVQVNSLLGDAACLNGNPEIKASDLNVVGDLDINGNPDFHDTNVNPGSPPMDDPLAHLPPPPLIPPAHPPQISGGNYIKYSPGYYPGGMNIKAGIKVAELAVGVYVFDNGVKVNGSASLIAQNVMIYVKTGPLELNGTGRLVVTPMTEDLYTDRRYIGVSIFQARDNYSDAFILGTGDAEIEGTLYFPGDGFDDGPQLEVGGAGIGLGNQIIAWEFYLHGSGLFLIEYDGRMPQENSRVFLVQ